MTATMEYVLIVQPTVKYYVFGHNFATLDIGFIKLVYFNA